MVKDIELYIFKDKYTKFQISSEESIPEMFRTVNVIVYKLRRLGQNMGDDVFSHQFLRCLTKKFKIIVTVILRGGLKNLTSTQVLGEIITRDTFDHNNESDGREEEEEEEKSIAFIVRLQLSLPMFDYLHNPICMLVSSKQTQPASHNLAKIMLIHLCTTSCAPGCTLRLGLTTYRFR